MRTVSCSVCSRLIDSTSLRCCQWSELHRRVERSGAPTRHGRNLSTSREAERLARVFLFFVTGVTSAPAPAVARGFRARILAAGVLCLQEGSGSFVSCQNEQPGQRSRAAHGGRAPLSGGNGFFLKFGVSGREGGWMVLRGSGREGELWY